MTVRSPKMSAAGYPGPAAAPASVRSAAGRPGSAVPAPEPGPSYLKRRPGQGGTLTATARCIGGCDWTTGPGDPAEVDRAAAKHSEKPPKHPTAVVAQPEGAA